MNGLRFDFENNDIILTPEGSFATAEISSQNCAMIANSELCRLTKPHIGDSLPIKLKNRRVRSVAAAIASGVRAVEQDGGRRVNITINNGQLQYYAEYGND